MRGKTRNPSSAKKRFYILDAIYHEKYIDSKTLLCEQVDFNIYIKELLDQGFIQLRDCENTYGTNCYMTTSLGDKVFARNKIERFKEYTMLAGTFTGAVTGQLLTQ